MNVADKAEILTYLIGYVSVKWLTLKQAHHLATYYKAI